MASTTALLSVLPALLYMCSTAVAAEQRALPPQPVHPEDTLCSLQTASQPQVVFRSKQGPCMDGRLGNLLFAWASLLGIAGMRGAGARACYDSQVFFTSQAGEFQRKFRLDRVVEDCERIPQSSEACTFTWREQGHTRFNESKVATLLDSIQARRACPMVQVLVFGCLQSWKYFDAIKSDIRSAFAVPPPSEHAANAWLEAQKTLLSREQPATQWRFVGIQVRLGDKLHVPGMARKYAPNDWSYFAAGMSHLREKLTSGHPTRKIAFIVTVGGGNRANGKEDRLDRANAMTNLTRGLQGDRLVFAEATEDILTDLSLLTSMDGLITSASTFGWWAGYLSQVGQEDGLVVAPRYLYRPESGGYFKAFHAEDYYPPGWKLIDNLKIR